MSGKKDVFYGLLTVRLSNAPATPEEAYPRIKQALGLADPVIDDDLGAVPARLSPAMQADKGQNEEWYLVGMDTKTLWKLVEEQNPNVVGCMHAMGYSGGNPPLFLKDPPPPPRTHGGPRRNGPRP